MSGYLWTYSTIRANPMRTLFRWSAISESPVIHVDLADLSVCLPEWWLLVGCRWSPDRLAAGRRVAVCSTVTRTQLSCLTPLQLGGLIRRAVGEMALHADAPLWLLTPRHVTGWVGRICQRGGLDARLVAGSWIDPTRPLDWLAALDALGDRAHRLRRVASAVPGQLHDDQLLEISRR